MKTPLALLLRPKKLEDIIGQLHILGPNKSLRKLIETDSLKSIILYGPPGTGKTSIAIVISKITKSKFVIINATSASVKDIRREADLAVKSSQSTVLFIDEIHRFSKTQQDVLLPYVEDGSIIFIGATTENPCFSVQAPLISRSTIFELRILSKKELGNILIKVIDYYRSLNKKVTISLDALVRLINMSIGDARRLITIVEAAVDLCDGNITKDVIDVVAPNKYTVFSEDEHFDLASAFQGSIQASDADSAIFWLAKWLESGEDPRYIARRLLVSAAEDAFSNPICTTVANAAFTAACEIGRPECDIVLAQATILIANSIRDKTAACAIWDALKDVRDGSEVSIPKEMRDSHYKGAKFLGNGQYHDGSKPEMYRGINKRYVKPEEWINKS